VSKCQHLHAAVLQVLLALQPRIQGEIADPLLAAALKVRAEQAQAA